MQKQNKLKCINYLACQTEDQDVKKFMENQKRYDQIMLELAKDEYDLMVEWSEANAVPEDFLFALRKIQLSELIKQGKIRQAVQFG